MNNECFIGFSSNFLQMMEKCVVDFFRTKLPEKEYNTEDLINLLLTVHINSLFASTESLSKNLDDGGIKVKAFNEKLSAFIRHELAILNAEAKGN